MSKHKLPCEQCARLEEEIRKMTNLVRAAIGILSVIPANSEKELKKIESDLLDVIKDMDDE